MTAAEAAQPPASTEPPLSRRDFALRFDGQALEYFRIWAVNLSLTLLTLGIYSAWAKVRKQRYFHSHTQLDRTPFQYLAQPLPILKGRVAAAVLLLVYFLASNVFVAAYPVVLAAGVMLAPWVLVRSAAFNARYTAFRNLTFQFDGNYAEAFRVLYAWGLIPFIVVGEIFDWGGSLGWSAFVWGLFGLYFPWWIAGLKRFLIGHTLYGEERGVLSVTGGQFWGIYARATGILVAGVLIMGLLMTLGMRLGAGMGPGIAVTGFALLFYLAYLMSFAYSQAHSGNLVWNNAELGPFHFASTMTAKGLARLYFSNGIGILLSLGLLIPWAVIRTMRYRIENLHGVLEGDIADLHGKHADAVRATGGEVGEFFDMDLSL